MKKNSVIRFVYDGYYSSVGEDVRWISREDNEVYSFLMKTTIGEVSYCRLVEKICSKIRVDEATTKLRVSYFPFSFMEYKIPNYIRDDEDVVCYLMEVNKEGFRSVLHVEVTNNDEQNQGIDENSGFGQVSREDRVREVVASNEEIPLIGRANDSSGGILAIHVGEPSQQNLVVVENDGNDDHVDKYGTFEDIVVEGNVASQQNLVVVDENDGSDVNVDIGVKINQSGTLAWEDGLEITVGQEFGSKGAIQSLVEKAGHKECFEFVVKKSEPLRYVVKCCEAHNGCKWYVRAARSNTFQCFSIRTHRNIHTCSRTTTTTCRSRRNGTPTLVASILAEDYPGKFDTPSPKNLIDLVQGRFGVQVSYSTAWRGRREAADDVRGTPEEGFMILHSYMFMLKKMNPDTVSHIEVDEKQQFKYLFFALGLSIEGFRVMRKVIIVDATHLKTVYGGVLIVATAQDPDHHHYPIAFGIVDGEKDASWIWFFKKLNSLIPDGPEIVFISDRNQSLLKAVAMVYPLSRNGHCIYHLSQNVKLKVSGVNKATCAKKFRECARAYTEAEFVQLYGDFSSRYPAGRLYLDDSAEVEKWARSHFQGEKYNIDTSNAVESINGVLKKARKYSLLQMIDAIIEKMAEWSTKYRKKSAEIPTGQKLVPFVEIELHGTCKEAKKLSVHVLNGYRLEYIVMGRDGIKYLVNLKSKTCSCKRFDIDKYPCVHAIAAAREAKKEAAPEMELHDLCSKYYWVELWVLAYSRTIYPVPHRSQWIVPEEIKGLLVLPPDYDVKLGRRQEKRYASIGEHRGKGSKKRSKRPCGLGEWFNNDGDQS